MTYGTWTVQGTQVGTPNLGSQSLGPFNVPFGPEISTFSLSLTSEEVITVPQNALGVWIIPPTDGTVALQFGTNLSTGLNNTSPNVPSFLSFDTITPNIPENIYILAASSVTIAIQFV